MPREKFNQGSKKKIYTENYKTFMKDIKNNHNELSLLTTYKDIAY